MPDSTNSERYLEITVLGQIITSVSSRLDGFAEDDPVAWPLREHLGELTDRRDLLLSAQKDSSHAQDRRSVWVFLLMAALGIGAVTVGLADLTSTSRISLLEDAIMLAGGAFFLLISVLGTFMTRSGMREYRRAHPGERS
jgi:hypothetical protein